MASCVDRLIQMPPETRREALVLFGYFASRLGEIGTSTATKLADANIVPVDMHRSAGIGGEKQSTTTNKRVSPRMVYLGDDSSVYGDIFTFVNFGETCNGFLLRCGSKHEPSTLEVAWQLVREPARLLGVLQSPEKYLGLLRRMAQNLSAIKKDKALFKEMKSAPFLLAVKDIPGKAANAEKSMQVVPTDYDDDDDDEDMGIKQYSLSSASRIVIIDDFNSYNLFRDALLTAPQEDLLESFYYDLGVPALSGLVQDNLRIGPIIENNGAAMRLRRLILERSKIFVHGKSQEVIKHDSRWLEKNLEVQVVSNISLRKSLLGYNLHHTIRRSAAIENDQHRGWTLWVTGADCDMFQVSQALVSLILSRPKPHSIMMFEMLLTTDLFKLRERGFNVDRILRAKAAEARIAEDQRQKQVEAEQKQIREQEEEWKGKQVAAASRAETPRPVDKQVAMPGAFGSDSPSPPQEKKPRGLFASFTKRLGIDTDTEPAQQLQRMLGGGGSSSNEGNPDQKQLPAPPPYDESAQGLKTGRHVRETEAVTAPHALHQNLVNAVQASRAHDSSTLFSPPTTKTVKEAQGSYCDGAAGQNINFLADAANGMRIFTANTLSVSPSEFLGANVAALNTFATLLVEVGDVYALPRKALHIFYDETGSTIAFNAQGSVFCNFRFYNQLHAQAGGNAEAKKEASVYWFVVVAHELAHNLVADHSAQHSFYTENFVAQYFMKMATKVGSVSVGAGSSPAKLVAGRENGSLLD